MLSNDATIQNIKHEILYEVAKLAYAGRFEEEKDELAYKMFPGPKARFRCCVYKEREIARQRIRLAEGKCPTESDHPGANNIIQVIEAACADCPLSHYIVTDNCRKCMMKACQQACKFGAVSMTRDRAYIDPDKCKECGMCAKACPYNAIADLIRPCKKICPANAITMDENGICEIDENKCIQCGQCIHACPFGAIGSKTDIVDVIKAIVDGKKVVAMVAPAVEGQFGDTITMSSIRTACKKLGFNDMYEVGLGGDLTAQAEAEEWLEAAKEGKKLEIIPPTDEQVNRMQEIGIRVKQLEKIDTIEEFIEKMEKLQGIGVDVSKIVPKDTILTLAQKTFVNQDEEELIEKIKGEGLEPGDKIGNKLNNMRISYRQAKKGEKSKRIPPTEEQVNKMQGIGIIFEKQKITGQYIGRLSITTVQKCDEVQRDLNRLVQEQQTKEGGQH